MVDGFTPGGLWVCWLLVSDPLEVCLVLVGLQLAAGPAGVASRVGRLRVVLRVGAILAPPAEEFIDVNIQEILSHSHVLARSKLGGFLVDKTWLWDTY